MVSLVGRVVFAGMAFGYSVSALAMSSLAQQADNGYRSGQLLTLPVLMGSDPALCRESCMKIVQLGDDYMQLLIRDGKVERAILFDEELRQFHKALEKPDEGYAEEISAVVLSTSTHGNCLSDCSLDLSLGSLGVIRLILKGDRLGVISVFRSEKETSPSMQMLPPGEAPEPCGIGGYSDCYISNPGSGTGAGGGTYDGYYFYYYDFGGCIYRTCFEYVDQNGHSQEVCTTNKLC